MGKRCRDGTGVWTTPGRRPRGPDKVGRVSIGRIPARRRHAGSGLPAKGESVVSPKQLAANRLNSSRSTGPRTAPGKAIARLNAVKHGLLGRLPIVIGLGETPEAWVAHREAVLLDLAPIGAVQVALAERVALLLFRMARAAKADAAASVVVFQPATAVETPPADPTVPDPAAYGVRALRQQLAAARTRAAAHHRAVELVERLDVAPDDEALDSGMTEALWTAALKALDMDPSYWGEHIALEVLRKEGVTGSDLAVTRRFCGWTVARLKAGLTHLAAGKGPVAELIAAIPDWLRHLARGQDRQVRELVAAVAAAEGERVAARVRPALETAATGQAALELVARYEGTQARELARALTLFFALRAAGPTRVAEAVD